MVGKPILVSFVYVETNTHILFLKVSFFSWFFFIEAVGGHFLSPTTSSQLLAFFALIFFSI